MPHTQETSSVVVVQEQSEKVQAQQVLIFARAFAAPRLQFYLNSMVLVTMMGYTTLLAILKKYGPHLRYCRRKTDCCDHCHMLQPKLLPRFWAMVQEGREDA